MTTPKTESENKPKDGFGLYAHWPFCLSKCPYCDFNSHVRATIDETQWRDALLRELDSAAQETRGRTLTSVFFGGGTPSLMPPAIVGAILDRAAQHWTLDKNVEITLEANPTSVETSRFQAFQAAGVNRASLGVQALDDESLKFLGREHGAAEARAAVELAARTFPRYSFDLIYARPNQTLDAWAQELRDAIAMAGDHLSVYQLTIEPGTVFHTQWRRGDLAVPGEDETAALYDLTQDILDAAGMPAYEISNHAAPSGESRHNLVYWRYQDYVGIGPGAHSRITRNGDKVAIARLRNPDSWIDRVAKSGSGMESEEVLNAEQRRAEIMLMGLRLAEGVSEARLCAETGMDFSNAFDPARLAALMKEDLLRREDGRLFTSTAGRRRLNAVLDYLLP